MPCYLPTIMRSDAAAFGSHGGVFWVPLPGISPLLGNNCILWCSVVPTSLGIAKRLAMGDKTSISTAVLTSPGLLAASPSNVISSPVSFGLGEVEGRSTLLPALKHSILYSSNSVNQGR